MDDKDWLMLKTIREVRSLSKAADLLYISQPALTYRLHNLEKEFGARILNRHAAGVSFTEQGEYILHYAEDMLYQLQRTKDFIQNTKNPVQGQLRLGISTVFAKFKVAPILKEFKSRFPAVSISLKTGSSTLVLPELLQQNEIDIAIVRGEIDWPEEKYVIMKEPWCLIHSRPVELGELSDIPWIMDETATLVQADKLFDLWWHDHFAAAPPSPILVNSIEACIQFVSHEIGWGIVPKIYLKKLPSLFCLPLYLKSGKPLQRQTFMLYNKHIAEQPPCKAFIDFILNQTQHAGLEK